MKLFSFDPEFRSPKSKITVGKLAQMLKGDIRSPYKDYLYANKPPQDSFNFYELYIKPGLTVVVGNSIFKIDKQVTLGNINVRPEHIDLNGEVVSNPKPMEYLYDTHADHYVFICDPSHGDDTQDVEPEFIITRPCLAPQGYTPSDCKLIGGFATGDMRVTMDYYETYVESNYYSSGRSYYKAFPEDISIPSASTDHPYGGSSSSSVDKNVYIDLGIIHNSVWTVFHRPACLPHGMVYIGNDLWGDIYLSSDDGNCGCQSKYNSPILHPCDSRALLSDTIPHDEICKNEDDEEKSCNCNWYGISERAAKVGKRLPYYHEFIRAALGTPNDLSLVINSNTIQKGYPKYTGILPYNVSVYNIHDLVGLNWIWLADLVDCGTTVAGTWSTTAANLQLGGMAPTVGCGRMYTPNATSVRAVTGGGTFYIGHPSIEYMPNALCEGWTDMQKYQQVAQYLPTPGFMALNIMFNPWVSATVQNYYALGGWCVADSI